jgi:nicotinamide riboside transporter PnuC
MSKLINVFIWVNTILAIVGTFLNAKQVRFGFIIWMITNAVFVGYNICLHSFQQAALFSVYFVLAVFGWFSWGKNAKKVEENTSEKV